MRKLYLIGLVLAGSAFALSPDFVADNKRDSSYYECAQACKDCQLTCNGCAAHCAKLLSEGMKDHLQPLQTCQDCAAICATAGCIVARKGPFSEMICKVCAEACKQCGEECAKFKNNPTMKNCADQCSKCERACRKMLQQVAAGK